MPEAEKSKRSLAGLLPKSKKARTLLFTFATVVLNKLFGLGLSEDQIIALCATASAYMIGQGVADNGKERAKVEKN